MELSTVFFILSIFAIIFLIGLKWKRHVMMQELMKMQEKENSWTFVFGRGTRGPEITALILNTASYSESIEAEDLAPQNFSVEFTIDEEDGSRTTRTKTVARTFFCNIDGIELDEKDSQGHIRLEFDGTQDSFLEPFVLQEKGATWKKQFGCKVMHPKFTEPLTQGNDPLITQEAKDQAKEIGLAE